VIITRVNRKTPANASREERDEMRLSFDSIFLFI